MQRSTSFSSNHSLYPMITAVIFLLLSSLYGVAKSFGAKLTGKK